MQNRAAPLRPARRVRSASLSGYEAAARAAGLDAGHLLSEAGLEPPSLLPPDATIPANAACRLLEDSAAASGNEHFGLDLSLSRRLDLLGPLALAMRDAPTVRDSLRAMVRFARLHSEAALLEVEETPGALLIRESLLVDHLGSTRQADEMIVGSLFRMLRELVGPAWRPRRGCFSHDAPRDTAAHVRAFGLAPEFGCDFNGIVCAAIDLEAPPAAHDPSLGLDGRRRLESMLARRPPTFTDEVMRHVRELLVDGPCGIEDVAARRGIDRRTVHRRLAREGTSFTDILAEVRAGLAVRYLSAPSRPVTSVGELLGFTLPSAFAHWFRRRFGCTPTAWRERELS